jgi:hypothetical protein
MLWAIRRTAGRLLGWDGPDAGLGARVPALRDRLPEDLRDAPPGPGFGSDHGRRGVFILLAAQLPRNLRSPLDC